MCLFNKKSIGACHADELNYLFYGQLFGFSPKANSPEYRMCRIMSKLWCNFAKTGYVDELSILIMFNIVLFDEFNSILFLEIQIHRI